MAKEEIENLDLIKKLAKIREISDVVSKDKRGYNYSYADITSILANITAGMKKYGVSLVPRIVPGTACVQQNVVEETKIDKTGKPYEKKTTEMLVSAEMVFQWINNDNTDETLEVPWFAVGSQADPSQAFGSALTYNTRYFLTSFFQIAQTDLDVDAYRSKQKEAEMKESTEIAERIIADFDTKLRMFISDNQDRSEDVKRFVSRFVKSGNYKAIKDPMIASKLLNDFTATFLN